MKAPKTIFNIKNVLNLILVLAAYFSFWLTGFNRLRILSQGQPFPWVVEGGCGAFYDTSYSLCFGNIFRKYHKSEGWSSGIARESEDYMA